MTPTLIGDYPNTYTFTKGLAEHIVTTERGDMPVTIVRPSIITGAYKEPYPVSERYLTPLLSNYLILNEFHIGFGWGRGGENVISGSRRNYFFRYKMSIIHLKLCKNSSCELRDFHGSCPVLM